MERGQTEYSGFEYVVETSNGNLMTLVQGSPTLNVGDRVLILYGSPSRLIADPRK
jgi:outer membrane lipoprotein SlyB